MAKEFEEFPLPSSAEFTSNGFTFALILPRRKNFSRQVLIHTLKDLNILQTKNLFFDNSLRIEAGAILHSIIVRIQEIFLIAIKNSIHRKEILLLKRLLSARLASMLTFSHSTEDI